MKKNISFVGFCLFIVLLLLYPTESVEFSYMGLMIWFEKMIPVLFPFMVITGIMIRMNITDSFAKILSPVFFPLFRVSNHGIYCIVIGFLCGFPMGAKVITDLYDRNKLSHLEAQYLLEFCNNIGPIYFCSFVLPYLGFPIKIKYIFGMYGIPFLYGIILRRTIYKKLEYQKITISNNHKENEINCILQHIDDSILNSINSILKLGGYMIFFNLLNLIPLFILTVTKFSGSLYRYLKAMLPVINLCIEVTSGIKRLEPSAWFIILILLPFGGLSCIAQTYSIIKKTDLSIRSYVWSKLILMLITSIYYVSFSFS